MSITRSLGFTIVELLVAMGLFVLLAGFVSVSVLRPQQQTNTKVVIEDLIADLRYQQMRAMIGDNQGGESGAGPFSIRILSNSYTLFPGSTYTVSNPQNASVSIQPFTLSTTFPSAQITFEAGSGVVQGWNAASSTITLTHWDGSARVLTINKYGAVSVN